MEGWLKGVMEEVDMEKVLKQVAKSTLNEKFLELATTERRETFTEGARELAE